MKKYALFFAVMCLVVSCKRHQVAEFSPAISLSMILKNPIFAADTIQSAQDTLHLRIDREQGLYVMDTIDIDDTVYFLAGFTTYANDLQSFIVRTDTNKIRLLPVPLNADMLSALSEQSDTATCNLHFLSGYNGGFVPIRYTPKQSGSVNISIIVASDSKFSPSTVTFSQPVSTQAAQ